MQDLLHCAPVELNLKPGMLPKSMTTGYICLRCERLWEWCRCKPDKSVYAPLSLILLKHSSIGGLRLEEPYASKLKSGSTGQEIA